MSEWVFYKLDSTDKCLGKLAVTAWKVLTTVEPTIAQWFAYFHLITLLQNEIIPLQIMKLLQYIKKKYLKTQILTGFSFKCINSDCSICWLSGDRCNNFLVLFQRHQNVNETDGENTPCSANRSTQPLGIDSRFEQDSVPFLMALHLYLVNLWKVVVEEKSNIITLKLRSPECELL